MEDPNAMPSTPPTVTTYLVGARFYPPALAILEVCPPGYPLEIRPEPQNEYGPNALAVYTRLSNLGEAALASLAEKVPGYGTTIEAILSTEWHKLGHVPATDAGDL